MNAHERTLLTALRFAGCLTTLAACLALASLAEAIPTPYDQLPAAICCYDNGLLWDQQLAASLNGGPGRRITVMDFCYSGGFINNLGSQPLSYTAAACDWDESSYSSAAFGQTFMAASKTQTLNQSFQTAYAAAVTRQLPQEAGDLGGASLNFLSGDRAILFSDHDPKDPSFKQDLVVARTALTTRANLPWESDAIESYYGDGTGETWFTGSATRGNLLDAITEAKDDLPDTGNLFLYLGDHGTSTDVVKSRVIGKHYEYQTQVSQWRGWTTDNPYGIWMIKHQLIDPDPAHYINPYFNKPGWVAEVVDGYMKYYSTNRKDPNTWLLSGVDYDFGYWYYAYPLSRHVEWQSISTKADANGFCLVNDWGLPHYASGKEVDDLGIGWSIWLADSFQAVDPQIWPGWMNGGDGWVLAPEVIPEPLTIAGTFLGISALGAYLRRRAV